MKKKSIQISLELQFTFKLYLTTPKLLEIQLNKQSAFISYKTTIIS